MLFYFELYRIFKKYIKLFFNMTAVESVSVCRETNYCTLGSQAVPATSCHSFAHYYFHRICCWKIIFRLCEQQGEPMTEPTKGGKRHMLVTLLFARQRSLSYYSPSHNRPSRFCLFQCVRVTCVRPPPSDSHLNTSA